LGANDSASRPLALNMVLNFFLNNKIIRRNERHTCPPQKKYYNFVFEMVIIERKMNKI
jgi:hypothetical protein